MSDRATPRVARARMARSDRTSRATVIEASLQASSDPGLAMDSPDLKAPQNYINRELSFLEFNQRVLDQALDESVPLLERRISTILQLSAP